MSAIPFPWFCIALLLAFTSLAGAETPVKIVAVDPEGVMLNRNGRLWKRNHPARFRVYLQNQTGQPQTGLLVSEAVGNLATVYSLGRERVDLAAKEKKLVMVCWIYPVETTFTILKTPFKVASAAWGHD